MDRSSNDGIYIMFTESHEILPNFIGVIDVMHEIHMNVGIKRLWYSNWNLQQLQMKYKGIGKFYLDLWSFV